MRALWSTILCATVATTLPGCGDSDEPHVPPPRTVAPSPTEGVDSAALGELLVEHWDLEVARDPFWGTWIGDHRVDRDLPPIARADVAVLGARRRALATTLETAVLPSAREVAGLAGLAIGADCYAAEIRPRRRLAAAGDPRRAAARPGLEAARSARRSACATDAAAARDHVV